MMSPSSLAVFELKFLQKSMMLTPCGPSAVPTGGAGVAFPAAICSFTTACIFFTGCLQASEFRRRVSGLKPRARSLAPKASNFFDLQKVQLHRCRPPENRDHHFQRVLVDVDVVHHAIKAGERTLVDPYLL